MRSAQMNHEHPSQLSSAGMVDMTLEVVVIAVSDVESSKRERKSRHAGIEKLDLELPIGDGSGLP